MKTLRLAVATSMAAAFVVFAQTPAQAYPVASCSIGVSDSTPDDGDDFTVTVTATPSEDGTDFFASYGSQNDSESDVTSFTTTFEADDDDELITATATREGATVSCSTTIDVDDDDDGDGDGDGDDDGDGDGNGGGGDNGGLLPNTGGERLAWLIIGGMLVLVGGGVLVASRRREA